jgi:RNA polymerase sigma-70 factor (ECF subfamily)
MDEGGRERLEAEISRRIASGDLAGAATATLRGYGPEIFSFLMARHRDETEASEVFSSFAEGLWRGLPTFAAESSVRTWAFSIARRLSVRHRRDAQRRDARVGVPAEPLDLSEVAAEVRSATLPYLRSEVQSRIAALRETLPIEDQELLILRVDRQLTWNDLAQVLRGEDERPLEGEALRREAARLRKRFQSVKERLREMGQREGLWDPDRHRS